MRNPSPRQLKRSLAALVAVCITLATLAIITSSLLSRSTQQRLNAITLSPPYNIREDVTALQEGLTIVDLHADSLLWNRNLLTLNDIGHVDVPRLQSANVALQVFSVVNQVPRRLNIERNRADSDIIRYLAIGQLWPPNTWFSPFNRALYQARKLRQFVNRSNGQLRLIKTAADIEQLLSDRQQNSNPKPIGALLAIEGAYVLEGKLDNLERLYDAGFRMLGLTHFTDNEVGGSAHGLHQAGLTDFGRQVLVRARELGMAIDLAHASPQLLADVLVFDPGSMVVSHTGVDGTCNNTRNLSDEQLQNLTTRDSAIGISLFPTAVCGTTVEETAAAMAYSAGLVGIEHVALGSDFDGATSTSVDASGLPLLTQALLDRGFSQSDLQLILGENALRVLEQSLTAE